MNTRHAAPQALVIAIAAAVLLAGGYFMATTHRAHGEPASSPGAAEKPAKTQPAAKEDRKLEQVTFGSGCFWCTEAIFDAIKGVESAESGYSGGSVENPTYDQVCTGFTGHAEVVQVTYDPAVVTFPELLEAFWRTHDPTTLNRQGGDEGTQYRSAIFYHTEEQQKEAEHYKQKLNETKAFGDPVVTEITKFEKFYPAEKYHQEYYAANPEAGYCRMVIQPKIEKFRKAFADKLKTEE